MSVFCYYYLSAFLFGAIVGSFLNVVIYRYNSGRSLAGRSFCASCGQTLNWYELFPVFSFFALRGRCLRCHSKISVQYVLVEVFTGLLFSLILFKFLHAPQGSEFLLQGISSLIFWPILMVIFVYDIRHKIIPDGLSYSFALLALAYRMLLASIGGFESSMLLDLLAGLILFVPFFLLWFLSKGRWMGLGDGKLSLGIGWMLGFSGGTSAVIFGFWAGAVFGVILILLSYLKSDAFSRLLKGGLKRVTMKSEVPFAPFLILGIVAVEFFGFSLFALGF